MGWRSGFWLERIGEMSTETGVSSLVRRQGALFFFFNFFMDLRFCLCQVCSDCEAAGRDSTWSSILGSGELWGRGPCLECGAVGAAVAGGQR